MRRALLTRSAMLACAVAVASASVGCRPVGTEGASSSPPRDAVRKTTEDGPISATVEVWPPKPLLGNPIHLRLTVRARDGATVELPPWGEALGRFLLIGRFVPVHAQVAPDGSRTWVQDYDLQAPRSGRSRIPPLRVEWTAAGSSAPKELWTDEVPLEVGTNLPPGALELRQARGALGPQLAGLPLWIWLLAAGTLAGIGVGIWLLRRARRRAALRARVSAYDVAMGRLRALEQAGSPDDSVADAWYVELSSIVRRYLEDRYGVRAPELTTEEFLREAKRTTELTELHRQLLSAFLASCDRVKFAGYRPGHSESSDVLGQARRFVEETRLSVPSEAEATGVSGGGGGRRAAGGAA